MDMIYIPLCFPIVPPVKFSISCKKLLCSLHNLEIIHRHLLRGTFNIGHFLCATAEVAKLFDTRAEFATAWPLEGWIQCDLRNLCENRLLQCIVLQ